MKCWKEENYEILFVGIGKSLAVKTQFIKARRNLDKFRLVALTKTALKVMRMSKKNYLSSHIVWFRSSAENCCADRVAV
jgi:hypothetical protein